MLTMSNTLYDPLAGCNLVSYSQLKHKGATYTNTAEGIILNALSSPILAKEGSSLYWFQLDKGAIQPAASTNAFPAYAIKEDWLAP